MLKQQGAALADGLTLVRLFLGPLVALVIILGLRYMKTGDGLPDLPYRDFGFAVLATVLFGLGALTDLLDDILGGAQKAGGRMFGWFDDAADAILIGAALLALLYVNNKAGVLSPVFLILALTYVARDILIAVTKGFDFTQTGWSSWALLCSCRSLPLLIISPKRRLILTRKPRERDRRCTPQTPLAPQCTDRIAHIADSGFGLAYL